jgi:raffinose/stachyose/melibiose transport system permease protein
MMKAGVGTKKAHAAKLGYGLAKHAAATIICLIMLIPIALVVLNSLKSQFEAFSMDFSLPKKIIWSNYSTVIQKGKIASTLLNSLIYSAVTVAISVPLSAMAAFSTARNRTRLNNGIYLFLVLGLTLSVNHVALMKIMQLTHLINTRVGLCMIYSALQIPFNVFLYYGFINSVPRELDEAGIIDGCGSFLLFFRIIFPLLRPATMTIAILSALNTWNDFVFPLYYVNSSEKWPITLGVYQFFGRYQVSWNLVCSDVVLMSLPVVALYLIGQKYIVSGITTGSVKG